MTLRRTADTYIHEGTRWPLSISPKETIGARPGTELYRAESKVIFCEDQMRRYPDDHERWRQASLDSIRERDQIESTN
tara:strand:+ start:2673 stop:2906 length:234 start_codon:yes stop_codon:yes gene_type:complete